jgi:hypothetical protein
MPEEIKTPDPLQLLQQQVEQLTRENGFLREERNTLENLVVQNITSSATPSKETPVTKETPAGNEASVPSVEALTKTVVDRVKAEVIEPRDKEAAKQKAINDLNTLAANPKTKDVVLYMDEMRAIARQHPDLSIKNVYALAKANAGPKQFPAADSTDTANLRTGQIKPAAGAERFSESPKVRSRAEVDDRRNKTFAAAFDDAWETVMPGKTE